MKRKERSESERESSPWDWDEPGKDGDSDSSMNRLKIKSKVRKVEKEDAENTVEKFKKRVIVLRRGQNGIRMIQLKNG